MLHRTRRIARMSTPLLALALMPAAAANAAATSHLVSFDQARKAMPSASALPGKPSSLNTVTRNGATPVGPCLADEKPLTLKPSHMVASLYSTPATKPGAMPTEIAISALVFHSAAAAKAGMEAIVHVETRCPKQIGDSEASIVRTLSAKYATAGWTGWRSTDHLTVAPDPSDPTDTGLAARLNSEYLLRGNVVLAVGVSGPLSPTNGAQQEAYRKKATTALLAGFAKL